MTVGELKKTLDKVPEEFEVSIRYKDADEGVVETYADKCYTKIGANEVILAAWAL